MLSARFWEPTRFVSHNVLRYANFRRFLTFKRIFVHAPCLMIFRCLRKHRDSAGPAKNTAVNKYAIDNGDKHVLHLLAARQDVAGSVVDSHTVLRTSSELNTFRKTPLLKSIEHDNSYLAEALVRRNDVSVLLHGSDSRRHNSVKLDKAQSPIVYRLLCITK